MTDRFQQKISPTGLARAVFESILGDDEESEADAYTVATDDVRADAIRISPRAWLKHQADPNTCNVDTIAVRHVTTLLAELDRLQRWKDEALPVIFGLRDLGRALDIPLGHSITGPEAAEKALALRNERDAARATLARIQAVAADVDQDGGHSGLARHILNIIGGEA